MQGQTRRGARAFQVGICKGKPSASIIAISLGCARTNKEGYARAIQVGVYKGMLVGVIKCSCIGMYKGSSGGV